MSNSIYIVFDENDVIFGVYEEYVDADERANELNNSRSSDNYFFHVEDYTLNTDLDYFE